MLIYFWIIIFDRIKCFILPANNWKDPSILACFGVVRICGRNDDAAASTVSETITAVATPSPIITVLACHQGLGISQKLQKSLSILQLDHSSEISTAAAKRLLARFSRFFFPPPSFFFFYLFLILLRFRFRFRWKSLLKLMCFVYFQLQRK